MAIPLAKERLVKSNHVQLVLFTPGKPQRFCCRGHLRSPQNVAANKTCISCKLIQARAAKKPKKRDPVRFRCGHLRTSDNRKGSSGDCLTCHREQQKARYLADPETHRRKASEYQKRNRSARAEYWNEWRRRNLAKVQAGEQRRKRMRRADRDAETFEYIHIVLRDPCVYCGDPAPEIDHIQPSAFGGSNHWTNLAPACKSCNSAKRVRSVLDFMLYRLA
jgi:hypothetical protein